MSVFFQVSLNLYRDAREMRGRARARARTEGRDSTHTHARARALCAPTTKLAPRHWAEESHTHTWISHCEVIRSKSIAFVHVGGEQAPGPGSAWLGSGPGCQG